MTMLGFSSKTSYCIRLNHCYLFSYDYQRGTESKDDKICVYKKQQSSVEHTKYLNSLMFPGVAL